MAVRRYLTVVLAVLCLSAIQGGVSAQGPQTGAAPSAAVLLDRYLEGDFEAVVATLASVDDFSEFADALEHAAPAWIATASPDSRARRELTAATVALEAARLGQTREWKQVQRLDVPEDPPAYFLVHWRPPARLLEWGCTLLRARPEVGAGERWWQLASLAVAERGQDGEFLVGIYAPPPRYLMDSIEHAVHLQARMPDEARVALAIGIGQQVQGASTAARRTFESLQDNPDVGPEAAVRLAEVMLRRNETDAAVTVLDRVELKTRDPWVLYLARFFKGRALEQRGRTRDAERAYRGALRAVPGAQSGTLALAALLARDARYQEASSLTEDMLAAPPHDPWRAFVDADDRFWPDLIARVRAEIHP